jgi:hypothetical protein
VRSPGHPLPSVITGQRSPVLAVSPQCPTSSLRSVLAGQQTVVSSVIPAAAPAMDADERSRRMGGISGRRAGLAQEGTGAAVKPRQTEGRANSSRARDRKCPRS